MLQSQIAKLRARYPDSAPASLIGAFVILHEVTAVLPVIGFFYLFEYTDLALGQRLVERFQHSKGTIHDWLQAAERKAERVGRRYGYFGYEKSSATSEEQADAAVINATSTVTNAVASYLLVKVRPTL